MKALKIAIAAIVLLACLAAALYGVMVLSWSHFPRATTSFFFGVNTDPVPLDLGAVYEDRSPDAKSAAIVSAATAFLESLDAQQYASATYDFTDNAQRSNWSNFPEGMIPRGGVKLGQLSAGQRTLLDELLGEVLSEAGQQNVAYQLAAEDTFEPDEFSKYGSQFFYTAFVGLPSETQPWMFQFGGHHLALNVTIWGADVTFSPMLTGGQPLNIQYEGQPVFVTEKETRAALALLKSLSQQQKQDAIRGSEPIDLLLGPGEFGTVVAPEGVRGSTLSASQKRLLVEVIDARLEFINADDHAAVMRGVMADLDDTYFAWWGAADAEPGFAYFRITGPTLVLEYAPQDVDESPSQTDHAHSMYRDPANDYGSAWLAPR